MMKCERCRELECVIADLTREAQDLRIQLAAAYKISTAKTENDKRAEETAEALRNQVAGLRGELLKTDTALRDATYALGVSLAKEDVLVEDLRESQSKHEAAELQAAALVEILEGFAAQETPWVNFTPRENMIEGEHVAAIYAKAAKEALSNLPSHVKALGGVVEKYHELLYCVDVVIPGEDRHQTAKRWLMERLAKNSEPSEPGRALAALDQPQGEKTQPRPDLEA
jgi:hypothetical protein